MTPPVPVTVLTGFLGAGKTTLLNALLRGGHGRLAVIVNEFGGVGVDGEILASGAEELVELANGCVCCTVRGDLLRTLHALAPRAGALDGLVIETTGLADPGPVAQTFLADEALRATFALDGIVTVVDALHGEAALERPEAREQAAFADLLVLTKSDLAADAGGLRARLAALNPDAPVIEAGRGGAAGAVLGLGGFDLARIEARLAAHGGHDRQDHDHGPEGIGTVTLTADRPLSEERVTDWLTAHLAAHGRDVLRTKGILDVAGEDRRLVLQGVRMMLEADWLGPWPPGPRRSRLVMIGHGLDGPALQGALDACVA